MIILTAAQDAISDLSRFDAIVDARSPAEYAEDRVPGAVNWPSLDDDERALVGTEYKQVSPFAARKRGAALVARNVAAHVERHVADKPPGWTPLVYCWRGGKRSGALATVLDQIGFRVHILDGGYRAYRRAVVAELDALPGTRPSTEPRWLAIASRSRTWPPWRAISASRRLLPDPVGPQTTRHAKRAGSISSSTTTARRNAW